MEHHRRLDPDDAVQPPATDYPLASSPDVTEAPPQPDGQLAPVAGAAARRPRWRWVRSLARYLVVWLAIFLVLKFVIPSYDVKGSSMVPTYQVQGDRVLTDHLFFKLFGQLERGDIVVLERGDRLDNDALIKRVVGLPGEKLEIKKGVVYINDQPLAESYIKNRADYSYPPTVLKSDCYFVLGDNRPVSLDSHYFGCIGKDQIQAKVILRYPWPL